LKRNLSLSQLAQYEEHYFFDVIGGDSGSRYRIHHGRQMNVEQLAANSRRTRVLCFTPEDRLSALGYVSRLPIGDILLAQKLALELFERDALTVANVLADPCRLWFPFT
jgi:hypothetical protein